jgi:hypothetical protein
MSVSVCRAGQTRNSSPVVAQPWPTDRQCGMASANGASDEVITTTEHRFPPLSANMCRSRDHKTGAEWDLALSLNGDAPHAQIAHSCCTVDNPLAVGSAGR